MPKKSGVLYGEGKENKEFPTVISTTAEQSGKISRPIASGHTEATPPPHGHFKNPSEEK